MTMQSHFDNVDLPSEVETLIAWMKGAFPTENTTIGPSSSTIPDLAESKRNRAVQEGLTRYNILHSLLSKDGLLRAVIIGSLTSWPVRLSLSLPL